MDTSVASRCSALENPSPWTTALAVFILVGILVSYLPQHIKIIQRRTSEGLSPWWVLLGGVGSICAMGCILVLPASRADLRCCREISGRACGAALLGVMQIGVQWACFMFIVFLFCIFFPAHPSEDLSTSVPSLTRDPTADEPPQVSHAVVVGATTIVSLLAVSIISIALVFAYPRHTQGWANTLGILAGLLSAVQYLPQIWYTWKLGDIKSLSLVTMLIQVPGAFLFALSLWLRVGWEGWGTWLIYVITGVLQAILFGIAVYYTFVRRKPYGGDEDEDEDDEDVSSYDSDTERGHDGTRDSSHHGQEGQVEAHTNGGGTINERTALLSNGGRGTARSTPIGKDSTRPTTDTYRTASNRSINMLYAATPPDEDSDASEGMKQEYKKKKGRPKRARGRVRS